jgi:hypothetical protein
MTQTAKPQVFRDITLSEMRTAAESYQARGWRFVNICGSTVGEEVELIYSFSDGLPLENLRFRVDATTELPSISDLFPNCFFFENETHDLYGVQFSNISIDFKGTFYEVSVPTPMNARSTQAKAVAERNPAAATTGNPAVAERNPTAAATAHTTALPATNPLPPEDTTREGE